MMKLVLLACCLVFLLSSFAVKGSQSARSSSNNRNNNNNNNDDYEYYDEITTTTTARSRRQNSKRPQVKKTTTTTPAPRGNHDGEDYYDYDTTNNPVAVTLKPRRIGLPDDNRAIFVGSPNAPNLGYHSNNFDVDLGDLDRPPLRSAAGSVPIFRPTTTRKATTKKLPVVSDVDDYYYADDDGGKEAALPQPTKKQPVMMFPSASIQQSLQRRPMIAPPPAAFPSAFYRHGVPLGGAEEPNVGRNVDINDVRPAMITPPSIARWIQKITSTKKPPPVTTTRKTTVPQAKDDDYYSSVEYYDDDTTQGDNAAHKIMVPSIPATVAPIPHLLPTPVPVVAGSRPKVNDQPVAPQFRYNHPDMLLLPLIVTTTNIIPIRNWAGNNENEDYFDIANQPKRPALPAVKSQGGLLGSINPINGHADYYDNNEAVTLKPAKVQQLLPLDYYQPGHDPACGKKPAEDVFCFERSVRYFYSPELHRCIWRVACWVADESHFASMDQCKQHCIP